MKLFLLTKQEMKKLVERVGGSMSEAQVRAIINKVDTDNNGLIDFTEFRGLWAVVTGDLEVHIYTKTLLLLIFFYLYRPFPPEEIFQSTEILYD